MKGKKKQIKEVKMHQHVDEFGIKFGAAHPENAEHKNEKTQKYHDLTIKRV